MLVSRSPHARIRERSPAMNKRGFLGFFAAAPAAAMVPSWAPEETKLKSSLVGATIGKPEAEAPTETLRHRLNYAKYRQMQRKNRKMLTNPDEISIGAYPLPEHSPYRSFKSIPMWKRHEMHQNNEARLTDQKEQDYITKLESMLSWDEKMIYDFMKNF